VRRVIRHKQRRLRAAGGLPIRESGRVSRLVALARPRSLGQALVELALVIPILLVLAMAALDLGRLYYARITLENASRAAALFAAETDDGSGNADTAGGRIAAVNEARDSFITVAAGDVSMSCAPSCVKANNNTVTAAVTGHFSLITPLLAVFTGGQNVTWTTTAGADIIFTDVTIGGAPTPTPIATPTPTPTPTPSPTPSGSPTPTPVASPSPTPTPTPTPCAAPFASFNYSQQNKNRPVVFTSTSTPTSGPCAISFWRWAYGPPDDTTDAGNFPTVSHQFALQGFTYQVTLTVTVPGGVTSSVTLPVTTKS
jgi:Flp pilus assembly protein TadG